MAKFLLSNNKFIKSGSKFIITGAQPVVGYNGTINLTGNLFGNDYTEVYIKYDSAPTSESDYDYTWTATEQGSASTTFTNKQNIYIWVKKDYMLINTTIGATNITLATPSEIQADAYKYNINSYNNAYKFTVTGNDAALTLQLNFED